LTTIPARTRGFFNKPLTLCLSPFYGEGFTLKGTGGEAEKQKIFPPSRN